MREGTTALWRVPAAGGAPQRLTVGSGPEREPSLSADGGRLVYSTSIEDQDVVVMERSTGVSTRLRGARQEADPALAPDGSAVAFVTDRRGRYELWLQPLAGGRPVGPPRPLAEHPGTAATPSFSPDGRFVAYFRVLDGQRDVWTVPVAGGLPTRVTDHPGIDIHPTFSPDGTRLAFVSDRDGGEHVWVVEVRDGRPVGEPQQVTTGPTSDRFPAWSPDGSRLAWVAAHDADSDALVGDAEGVGEPVRVTSGMLVRRVLWEPAGGYLLVSGSHHGEGTRLWRIPLDGGEPEQVGLEPAFGNNSPGSLDFSRDNRVLAYVSKQSSGDLWMLEGRPGRL